MCATPGLQGRFADRVTSGNPELMLNPGAAVAFTMVLHGDGGRVEISCQERGGPAVTPPPNATDSARG